MPAVYLLYFYGVMALIGGLFYFFNIYHILKFGLDCTATRLVVAAYTAVYGLALVIGIDILLRFDWTGDLTINLQSIQTGIF
tara:strand:- start:36 stop:281 length:246 start_codon:yes stop_codon:yes gene_type:complete